MVLSGTGETFFFTFLVSWLFQTWIVLAQITWALNNMSQLYFLWLLFIFSISKVFDACFHFFWRKTQRCYIFLVFCDVLRRRLVKDNTVGSVSLFCWRVSSFFLSWTTYVFICEICAAFLFDYSFSTFFFVFSCFRRQLSEKSCKQLWWEIVSMDQL